MNPLVKARRLVTLRARQALYARATVAEAVAALEAANDVVTARHEGLARAATAIAPQVGAVINAANLALGSIVREQAELSVREAVLQRGACEAASRQARVAAREADGALRRAETRRDAIALEKARALDKYLQELADGAAQRKRSQA